MKRAAWLLACCCAVAPAWAQEQSDAERLFEEGRGLFERGEIARACTTFEQSLALERTVGTLINLARCHAEDGRSATAWREYLEVAKLAADSGQADRERGARDLAAEIEPKVPRLSVTAPSGIEGLTVTLNDEPIEIGEPVLVDPSEYRIEARAPGRRPWKTIAHVKGPGVVEVEIPDLAPLAAPVSRHPPPAEETSPSLGGTAIAGIAIGGVGVIALVAGGALGAITLSEVAEAQEDEALCGPDKECTADGLEVIAGAERKGIASTVLLGVGGVAFAVGIVLVVVGAPRDESALVVPFVGPDRAGLALDLSF